MSPIANTALRRYWIEFDPGETEDRMASMLRACGVTAYSPADALVLLREVVFRDGATLPVRQAIEDVDVAMLDAFHVGPTILPPNQRGDWYPPIGVGAR